MSQLSRTALLFLLAVMAGCSLLGYDGPGDDFFPLEVGRVWTYDWEESWGHVQAGGRWEGTVMLAVVGETPSSDGTVYTLTEHKEGLYVVGPHFGTKDTTVVDETRTIAARVIGGEVALPDPYMSSGVTVPRYLPASEPDTVAFEGVYFGGCSLTVGGGSSELQLTRGVGMVYHSYWKGGSSQSCSGTLQLQSGE